MHVEIQRAYSGGDFCLVGLDKEYLEDLQISTAYARFQHSSGDTTTTPPPGVGSNYSNYQKTNSCTPDESFKRGIEHYLTLCNSLKDGKHWDIWRRHLVVTPIAQDVDDVLNFN